MLTPEGHPHTCWAKHILSWLAPLKHLSYFRSFLGVDLLYLESGQVSGASRGPVKVLGKALGRGGGTWPPVSYAPVGAEGNLVGAGEQDIYRRALGGQSLLGTGGGGGGGGEVTKHLQKGLGKAKSVLRGWGGGGCTAPLSWLEIKCLSSPYYSPLPPHLITC